MSSETPYKVLCVCLGNICRSPTAEIVLRHYCDEANLNVMIDSAGTSNYHPNKAPDSRSQLHAKQRGYDLSVYLLCAPVSLFTVILLNLI